MTWKRLLGIRPKIALYWCSGCGGCEESVIDLAEDLPDLLNRASVVFWPVAMDFRLADVAALPDRSLAAVFINGAIRTEEHVRMARLLRAKARRVVAHGACAHLGGVVGLANATTVEHVLETAFVRSPTVNNPAAILPGSGIMADGEPADLPRLTPNVMALDQVVPVDHYLPGCPPTPDMMRKALTAAVADGLADMPRVMAEETALCRSCPRRKTRPDRLDARRFRRLHASVWDPEKCFLDQGLVCLGPATRGGCGARCVAANMPCRGCFGPLSDDTDPGAAGMSLLASLLGGESEDEIRRAARSIPDPAGLIYRYAMAVTGVRRGGGR